MKNNMLRIILGPRISDRVNMLELLTKIKMMSVNLMTIYLTIMEVFNLTTIADPWYFDRAFVFQRLINQSFYQEMLLLQKFNDIGGKVLKPKKIQPPTSKK